MNAINPEFIVNGNFEKKSVVLPYSEWLNILEQIEELEDIKLYDNAKNKQSEILSFNKAVNEIRNNLV